jgi:cytochrome o ubiquinol oxidase subunit 2
VISENTELRAETLDTIAISRTTGPDPARRATLYEGTIVKPYRLRWKDFSLAPEKRARFGCHLPTWLTWPIMAAALLPLGGCGETFRLFYPKGPVAAAQLKFTMIDVGIMLLIILPTTLMLCLFIWRYAKARNAAYDPEWSHSLTIELLIWGGPIAIVAMLAVFTYESVIETNPYDPTVLQRSAAATMPAQAPLLVDVITTDWQWFFIYPQQHIATIDDLVVPQGRVVRLRMTSTSVTNDFFIPQLAPMIDVMPGMQTRDVFSSYGPGNYTGFSADFSGAGFAWMQFSTRVMSGGQFSSWIASVQAGQAAPNHGTLTYAVFQKLAHPTLNIGAKPAYFSAVDPNVFNHTVADAMDGVTYPVPADLTEKMAPSSGPSVQRRNTSNPKGL